MKRIKKYIVAFVGTFLMLFNIANADSVKLKGDSSFRGDEFSVILEISSTSDVAAIQVPVSWDEDKIEIVSTYDKNKEAKHENLSIYNFTFPAKSGENLLLDAARTKTGTIETAKIYIQAKDGFKVGETTTITLGNGMFAGMSNNGWNVPGSTFTIKRESVSEEKEEEPTTNKKEENNASGDKETAPETTPETTPENTNNQKEENTTNYSCKKIEGVYYDKNGKVVTKEQHEKECLKNTETGYFVPGLGMLVVIAGYVFIKKKPLNRI